MNKNHKSFVCGIKGKYLSEKEKSFLAKYKPWGIILFSRNIKSIKQTKILTNSIKKIFKNENYPILIDEEGGRVTRLKKFTTSVSLDASISEIKIRLLYSGCFLTLFIAFKSISHKYTDAPFATHTLVVTHPIPDAPAEIIIFLF